MRIFSHSSAKIRSPYSSGTLAHLRSSQFVVVGVLGLAACAAHTEDEVIDIRYDPCDSLVIAPASGATANEIQSIRDAIDMWHRVAPTHIALADDRDDAQLVIGFESAAPVFHGVYRDELGDILVNRSLVDPRQRTVTIAHEMGHAFGFWHIDASERASVMNAGNLVLAPTLDDASALADLWATCADAPMAHRMLPPRPNFDTEDSHAQNTFQRSIGPRGRHGVE